MNDSELAENFYKACFHYAKVNGDDPSNDVTFDFDTDWVKLVDNGSGIQITQWSNTTSQPTNTQLKAYSVNEVQQTWNLFMSQKGLGREIGTSAITFTGPWNGTKSVNFLYDREGTKISGAIESLADTVGNNTSTIIQSTVAIPISIRPNVELDWPMIVKENGTKKYGLMKITTSGVIQIYPDLAESNFIANTGNNGFNGIAVGYSLKTV